MAFEPIFIDVNTGEAGDVVGKIVNFYDTYANALAHGATGLVTVRSFNQLTFLAGSAITQTAQSAGPAVDNNGMVKVALDTGLGEVYAMSKMGRFQAPIRIVIDDLGTALQSESSSSESSKEFSSFSSSSTVDMSTSSNSSSSSSSETSSSSSTVNLSTSSESSSSTSSEGTLSVSSSSSSGLP